MSGPAIGRQPSFTTLSPSLSTASAQKIGSSGAPTAGQPSFTKPSPSSSVAFAHWPPDSSMPGMPPALGFATTA
jgi:hypothetical protein